MFSPEKGEVRSFAGKWLQLKTVMLSALSQEDEYSVSSHMLFLVLYGYINHVSVYDMKDVFRGMKGNKWEGEGKGDGGEPSQYTIHTCVKCSYATHYRKQW